MAQGDITAKLTDIHIDRNSLRISCTGTRYQEDSDGTLNSIETITVHQTFASQAAIAALTVLQIYNSGVTQLKAADSKMPNTVG